MSLWYDKKGKSYASKGSSSWVKYYAEHLFAAFREEVLAKFIRHFTGAEGKHKADDVLYTDSVSVKQALDLKADEAEISGKADKAEVLSKTNTNAFTPKNDYNPATKKYVDDLVGSIEIIKIKDSRINTLDELMASSYLDDYAGDGAKQYLVHYDVRLDEFITTEAHFGRVAKLTVYPQPDSYLGMIRSICYYQELEELPIAYIGITEKPNLQLKANGTKYVRHGGYTSWGDWELLVNTYDGLDSTDTDKALSANQGRVLNDKIDDIYDDVLIKYNTNEYTPKNDYNPATKKYVDDNKYRVETIDLVGLANSINDLISYDNRLLEPYRSVEIKQYLIRFGSSDQYAEYALYTTFADQWVAPENTYAYYEYLTYGGDTYFCNALGDNNGYWEKLSVNPYDGLDSTDTDKALSANQGRVLNDKINDIEAASAQPSFVDSLDEMTDTRKKYVYDGYIWEYKEHEVVNEPTNTSVLAKDKVTLNGRLSNSSGNITANGSPGFFVTDFIPATDFSTTAPYNVRLNWELPTNAENKVVFYNADKERVGSSIFGEGNTTIVDGTAIIDIKTATSTGEPISTTDATYIRMQLKRRDNDVALTEADLDGLEITLDANEIPESTETITEWVNTGHAYQPMDYEDRIIDLETDMKNAQADIDVLSQRVDNLEDDTNAEVVIPTWWESAVDECIDKIKALQVGRNCVTFPFFSDNHQRNGYAGALIKKVMDECNIPYCFYGGDSISSGYIADEATMIKQDKKFDTMMKVIPNGRFCRAVGNHDGFWKVSDSESHSYTREQVYELFLREESISQSKHFGNDGTYYYLDDETNKIRYFVLNTNSGFSDAEQVAWFSSNLNSTNSGWSVVIISHAPITNNFHSGLSHADTVQEILEDYIESDNSADVIGWFSGHIHRDRIYQTDHTSDTDADDTETVTLPFKTVTIMPDNVAIGYGGVSHPIDNSDQSHAIDFVTINKTTRKVNLTRLGFGEDREYSY